MSKIVFILFNGWGGSKNDWLYGDNGTQTPRKLDFTKKLEKLGQVYLFNSVFFNIAYYETPTTKEEKRIMNIDKKYGAFDSNIMFNKCDLNFKNICIEIYKNVIKKYGSNKKYVLIGWSYGGNIALLFSKLFKKKVLFNVLIDNVPYCEEYLKKYSVNKKEQQIVNKYIKSNNDLQNILFAIKNKKPNKNVNNEIKKVYALIGVNSTIDRLKYFNPKLPVYTIIFRAYTTQKLNTFSKTWNKYSVIEKDELLKNNKNIKYIICLDAHHNIHDNQEYCDNIINEIKYTLQNITK
jgi:hypothetical protein